MINKMLRLFSTLILVSILLAACSGTSSTVQNQPLRVGWSLWPGWYPLVIAKELGYFEKHNVQVELVYYDIYADIIPALGSGMLDGGGLALGDTVLNDVAEDIKIVLITDASDGADLIVSSPEITNVQDLRGKRLGFQSGTYVETLVKEMLSQNGISSRDITFVEVAPEDIPNAIPGIVDAGVTYEPYGSESRAKGFNLIFSSADTPGLLLDVFAFRKNIIEQRPEDVRGFIAAWFEGLKYWQDNPTEGNAIIAKALGMDVKDVNSDGIKLYTQQENLTSFQEGSNTTSIYYPLRIENQNHVEAGITSFPVAIDSDFLDPSFLQ